MFPTYAQGKTQHTACILGENASAGKAGPRLNHLCLEQLTHLPTFAKLLHRPHQAESAEGATHLQELFAGQRLHQRFQLRSCHGSGLQQPVFSKIESL